MTQPAWIENEALARELTELGWKWQRFVGNFFEASGFEVELPDYSFRDTVADIKDYSDSYDLMVEGERIEVKSRDLYFTAIPMTFPYPRAFVDTVSSYDHYKIKPLAYVFVSQQTGGMLCAPGRNQAEVDRWEIVTRKDHVRGITDDFYTVARNRLTPISKLVELLRNRV